MIKNLFTNKVSELNEAEISFISEKFIGWRTLTFAAAVETNAIKIEKMNRYS